MAARSAIPPIPEGLLPSESDVYKRLIGVAEQHKGSRPIVVITALGKKYDHLAALVVLKELHRLGLVELRAVIADLMPSDMAARFTRAALDSLGLPDVPVACGIEELNHEMDFDKVEFSGGDVVAPRVERDGQDLLREVYENAEKRDEKLHLLCQSSLQVIHQFASNHSDLFEKSTAEVHVCGQYISDRGILELDKNAANSDAAEASHSSIPTHRYTYDKSAALVALFTQDVFVKLEATGHPIGAYLRRVQKKFEKDAVFPMQASKKRKRSELEIDPEEFVDQGSFLVNEPRASERDVVPTGEEIVPHLHIYVHAALGVAGEEAVAALNVFQSTERTVDGKLEAQLALSSILKGSLLDAVCKFCNRINFEVVGLNESGYNKDNLFKGSRPFQEVLKNSKKCMFCREVAISFRDWSRGKFDIQAHLKNERAHYQMVPGNEDERQGCLIRMQVTLRVLSHASGACDLILHFQRCSRHLRTVKDSCEETSPTDWGIGQEHAYIGRIRPSVVDTRLFRKWIETCSAMHSDPYCGKSIQENEEQEKFMGLDGLRLIDVVNMCVVDGKGNRNYTALSYVWGQMSMAYLTTGNLFREAGSLRREMLPKTIGDAIEVTERLGFQYMWIDCLCIVQDDERDKQYFIPQMGVIFRCASVTIVAASGDNADAGLPGVRPNTRTPKQVPFMIKGVSLMRTLDPERGHSSFDGYLKDAEWCKRAWTFQEKLLSGRALIFTEEQVYWECQKATWCEDGFWETMNCPVIYRHCFGDKDYCHPWEGSFERRYRKMVDEYSGRILSHESDRCNALEGILKRFPVDRSSQESAAFYFWALPKSHLSNALTWCYEEYCPERRTRKNMPPSIYSPFPSWSWLGWGKVCFNNHSRLYAKTVDLIFYYFDETNLVSLNAFGDPQSLSEMGIRKDGDKTYVDLEDIPGTVKGELSKKLFFWSSTANLRVRHEVDSDGNDKLVVRRNGKVVPASFWFHKPFLPDKLAEFEFVIIAKFVEYREESPVTREQSERLLAVLLVSWENDVAYRKGLVHIDFSDWKKLDNQKWKLICLG